MPAISLFKWPGKTHHWGHMHNILACGLFGVSCHPFHPWLCNPQKSTFPPRVQKDQETQKKSYHVSLSIKNAICTTKRLIARQVFPQHFGFASQDMQLLFESSQLPLQPRRHFAGAADHGMDHGANRAPVQLGVASKGCSGCIVFGSSWWLGMKALLCVVWTW